MVPAAEAKKLGLIKTTKVEPGTTASGSKEDKDAGKKAAGDPAKDKKSLSKEPSVTEAGKKVPGNKEN